MLVTPKNGTACFTFALVIVSTGIIHLPRHPLQPQSRKARPEKGPGNNTLRHVYKSNKLWRDRRDSYPETSCVTSRRSNQMNCFAPVKELWVVF